MLSLAVKRLKKPFFSKKCFFWPENDFFSKKSFYSKFISDQNYSICTCQKIHFQNRIMRLQFSPDSTYSYMKWLWSIFERTPLSTGLLYPKFQVQTSGIIQKLYETKPDAYMRFCIYVTWLFPQIIPKMWDSVHFTL